MGNRGKSLKDREQLIVMRWLRFLVFASEISQRIQMIGAIRADDLLCTFKRQPYFFSQYEVTVEIPDPYLLSPSAFHWDAGLPSGKPPESVSG